MLKNKRAKKRGAKRQRDIDMETESKIGESLNSNSDENAMKRMVARHAGIIGLCAFVNAYPYDVPEFIPDVLMFLSGYVHEVQPITVRIHNIVIIAYNFPEAMTADVILIFHYRRQLRRRYKISKEHIRTTGKITN